MLTVTSGVWAISRFVANGVASWTRPLGLGISESWPAEPSGPPARRPGARTDALDVSLEQQRPAEQWRIGPFASLTAKRAGAARAVFGGRCQGVCPMCGLLIGGTMAATATDQRT